MSPPGWFGFNGFTYIPPNVALTSDDSQHNIEVRDLYTPTAASGLRVYNTFTDQSNGEWGGFDWTTTPNVLTIGAQANGTGTKQKRADYTGRA